MSERKVSKRHLARELALKHLYAMQLGGEKVLLMDNELYDKEYYEQLITHVLVRSQEWDDYIRPCLVEDNLEEITQIDRAILWIGVYELKDRPEIPWRVIINEAVELAKNFGAQDSFKMINAVLDRLSVEFRKVERSK